MQTQQSQEQMRTGLHLLSSAGRGISLHDVGIRPGSRSFVVGSTGSGKSTLSCALVEHYRRMHPRSLLWIIDPKRRFVPVDPRETDDLSRVFPDGWRETNHGRRNGVSVFAAPLHGLPRHLPGPEDESVYLIQDESVSSDFYNWIYSRSDVRRPSLVYCDESFDLMRGSRADPGFRRLMQQGRELGIGVLVINQRPAWIDATFVSEADVLYIGRLNKVDDRERMQKELAAQDLSPWLDTNLPRFHWIYADQTDPERSRVFTVRMVKSG